MIGAEDWMDTRQLHEQGLSIRAISRRLGINRKTVRKTLKQDRPPGRQKRRKPSQLDPFKPYIESRLRDYPELTAKRILEEIRDQGFAGGYTIVKDFVVAIRPQKDPIAVLRFETPPGHQGQVDWGEFGTVILDGIEHKLYLFSMILGYSRARYIEFTLDITTPTLLQCHLNAFRFFGGYPKEILYDNMKQVVLEYNSDYDKIRWNPSFLAFANHFGFTPRTCRPYRAQTKGKVERLIRFVRTDFFYGRAFTGLQDINSQSRNWYIKVNDEPHSETRIPPSQALEDEPLRKLTDVPEYIVTRIDHRMISRDCYVHYEGNRYSVPWKNAYREAVLKIRENKLIIEVAGTTVAIHKIVSGTGRRVSDPRHFDGLPITLGGRPKKARPAMDWTPAHEVVARPLSDYERTLDEYAEESS